MVPFSLDITDAKTNVGDKENHLYINTEKARSWEEATRLQLPFTRLPSLVADLSGVLTKKDFSMKDKEKVLKSFLLSILPIVSGENWAIRR